MVISSPWPGKPDQTKFSPVSLQKPQQLLQKAVNLGPFLVFWLGRHKYCLLCDGEVLKSKVRELQVPLKQLEEESFGKAGQRLQDSVMEGWDYMKILTGCDTVDVNVKMWKETWEGFNRLSNRFNGPAPTVAVACPVTPTKSFTLLIIPSLWIKVTHYLPTVPEESAEPPPLFYKMTQG